MCLCSRIEVEPYISTKNDMVINRKIEYISDTTDLAILSFEYEGDLTIFKFESNKLSKNDKIMVIDHPEGNKYQISYGYIKSNLKNDKQK